MSYRAPTADQLFILDYVVGYKRLAETDHFAAADYDMSQSVLTEAGRLCDEVIAPLRRAGDLHPAVLENGVVRATPGFEDAYQAIAEGGWVGISGQPDYGGLGLPFTLTTCVNESMSGANLALQLCPMLSQGQIEALERHADPEMKALYLPKLTSGAWAGTMNLTEPQAGSDVGALTTRAEPKSDGSYAITGQKIYISWGDHDMVENICHLVLARLPDAPRGTKGISLFLVPKRLPDDNGKPGIANRVKTVSLEHKLGLHGSPTAVLQYESATGWLVGAPHEGMAAMFTMMNNARLGVAAQGVGVAEAAFQQALAFARERVQGRTPTGAPTIADHADVRRMLTQMKADIFAARALALDCTVAMDLAQATGKPEHLARAGLLTPVAKSFGTDTGIDVARLGVQIHGGMGVIEETGAAQYSRDVRVTSIYEGTNGIQAMDLTARKMADHGEAAFALISEIANSAESADTRYSDLAKPVSEAATALRETTEWLVSESDMTARFGGAVSYLRAVARVLGAHYHLRAAMAQDQTGPRAALARFYITRLLPEHGAALSAARAGSDGLYDLSLDDLAA